MESPCISIEDTEERGCIWPEYIGICMLACYGFSCKSCCWEGCCCCCDDCGWSLGWPGCCPGNSCWDCMCICICCVGACGCCCCGYCEGKYC